MTDDMNDADFIEQFESCTLSAASFHHPNHVKLAWLYLKQYPLLDAVARFSQGLKRFAAANGKPERYHETVTWAFLFLIHQRMSDGAEPSSDPTWEVFAAANADLLNWEENILKRYYQEDTLQSERAKKMFLLPDRLLPQDTPKM